MTSSSGATAEGGWLNGSMHGKIKITQPSTNDKDQGVKLQKKGFKKNKDGSFYLETNWTNGYKNQESKAQASDKGKHLQNSL